MAKQRINTSAPQETTPALAVVVSLGIYLLVTSTFYPLDFLSVFDAKRVLQLVLFAVLMVFTIAWAPLREMTFAQLGQFSPFTRTMLIVLFALGLTSALRLEHPAYSLIDISMIFVMLLLVTVTAASRDLSTTRFDKFGVLLLALMGVAVVLQEFMGIAAGWAAGSEFNYSEALMHFAHPRFYNQLQTWSIPVLAALPLLFPARKRIKLICIVLLGLQWFLVISNGARGTTVSLFIAMAFIAFWLPEQRRHWLRYQLSGVLAGIIIYAAVLFLNTMFIPEPGDFYAKSMGRAMVHTSGRSTLWRLSIDDAINHPLLGTGPTQYACDSNIVLPAHPYSFPLRILGEWGVIAFILVLFLAIRIGLGFLNLLRRPISKIPSGDARSEARVRAMLSISIIAGAIHACLSGLLIMPASQVMMILVAGWGLSLTGGVRDSSRNSIAVTLLLTIGLLIAGGQVVFSTQEIPRLSFRTSYAETYGPMMPRFWQDGRVCEYSY